MTGALDQWGLDASLYARCLLSILRQPPGEPAEDSVGSECESEEAYAVPDLKPQPLHRRRLPSEVKVVGGSTDLTEVALLECLSTAELGPGDRASFVRELLRRYRTIESLFALAQAPKAKAQLSSAADSSLDSGVCPSPDTDSFQNYDQAFPPLDPQDGDKDKAESQDPPPPPPPLPLLGSPAANPTSGLKSSSTLPSLFEPLDFDPLPCPPAHFGITRRPRQTSACSVQSQLLTSGTGGHGGRLRLSSGCQPFTTQWSRPRSVSARFGTGVPRGWAMRPRTASGTLAVQERGGLAQLTVAPVVDSFDSTAPSFVVPKAGPTPLSTKVSQMGQPTPPTLPVAEAPEVGQTGGDLWSWLSDQTASVDRCAPPPSPGLPDLLPHDLLHIINEDDGASAAPWPTMGDFSAALAADLGSEEASADSSAPEDPAGYFCVPKAPERRAAAPKPHFQPIRTPGMEAAFVPAPRDPEGPYAVDYEDGQEWFVLRDGTANGPRRVRHSSLVQEAGAEAELSTAPKRRKEAPPSLPLKFQAGKPAKEVQTEAEEEAEETLGDDAWDSFDAADADWEKWRPADARDLDATDDGQHLAAWLAGLDAPAAPGPPLASGLAPAGAASCPAALGASASGHRMVSLGAGSSIWEQVPRTAVPAWAVSGGEGTGAGQRRQFDSQSEAADDDLLLSLVGGISVNAPLQ